VLDLGAGHGELSALLAQRSKRLIAVEDDPRLARLLRHRFAEQPNVIVREQDLFTLRLPRQPYKVVASIPFDGSARLLSRLTGARHAPVEAHVVVQREAAERITGSPRQTLFGLLRQPWFEPRIVHHFRRTDFAPPPRVEVVFLRLRKRGPPLVADVHAEYYRQFVSLCFEASARSVGGPLESLLGRQRLARIARDARLETESRVSAVPFEVWLRIFDSIAEDRIVRAKVRGLARARRRLL
jgi:23S rRNA (adenine-N6)-dimethyltransferase